MCAHVDMKYEEGLTSAPNGTKALLGLPVSMRGAFPEMRAQS